MSECKGCRYENSTDIREHLSVCNYCQRAYAGIDRYYHVDRYEKPKTNADRIRAMSDEELAEHFSELIKDTKRIEYCTGVGVWLHWLQSEAEQKGE